MSEPEQPTLFDDTAARAARDRDMERVDQAADPEWKEIAYDAVVACARANPGGFIVDDVWQHIPEGSPVPREPRAMGPVMRRAQRDGVIVATTEYRLSSRVTAHKNPRRVWRPL